MNNMIDPMIFVLNFIDDILNLHYLFELLNIYFYIFIILFELYF